jgi:hypothetical protein
MPLLTGVRKVCESSAAVAAAAAAAALAELGFFYCQHVER